MFIIRRRIYYLFSGLMKFLCEMIIRLPKFMRIIRGNSDGFFGIGLLQLSSKVIKYSDFSEFHFQTAERELVTNILLPERKKCSFIVLKSSDLNH